jgi:hypothetical protein
MNMPAVTSTDAKTLTILVTMRNLLFGYLFGVTYETPMAFRVALVFLPVRSAYILMQRQRRNEEILVPII